MTITTCVFCSQRSIRAKEHVFPRWLLRRLDAGAVVLDHVHRDNTNRQISHRRHNLDNLRYGRICASCNNNWLSALETEAQGILGRLWGGTRRLRRVEAGLLAAWTLKTVALLNLASNYRRLVPDSHIAPLRFLTLPSGLFIDVAFASTPHGTTWIQSQSMRIVVDPNVAATARTEWEARGYHFALGLDNLLLRVIHVPHARFTIPPFDSQGKSTSRRVWPVPPSVALSRRYLYSTVYAFADDAYALYAGRAA